jgi:hypothetical protein
MIYFIEQANKEQRELFMQNLIKAKTNPQMDIVGIGKANAQMLQYEFSNGLIDILNYLREEVLMVTRVPKIWIGMTSQGNRSTAEASLIPFEARVNHIQHIFESYINRELMPKLGYENLRFKFNPVSLMAEKAILSNAQLLSTLNWEEGSSSHHLP